MDQPFEYLVESVIGALIERPLYERRDLLPNVQDLLGRYAPDATPFLVVRSRCRHRVRW